MMANDKLPLAGAAALAAAALCCLAPALAVLIGAAGLSALLGVAGYVFVPALILLASLAAYAIFRQRQRRQRPPHDRTDMTKE
jgi:membrane protein implicated in regulation of membrane protease activity